MASCDRQRVPHVGEAIASASSLAVADRAASPPPASAAIAEPRPRATGALRDTIITARVKAAIAADPAMKDSDVSVSTEDGVVRLAGSVKSQDQTTVAANLAQRQEGVRRVETGLSVR